MQCYPEMSRDTAALNMTEHTTLQYNYGLNRDGAYIDLGKTVQYIRDKVGSHENKQNAILYKAKIVQCIRGI